MDITKTDQRVLSLCTGLLRGIERGIEATGTKLDIISYVEIEAVLIQNLVCAMEQGVLAPAPIWPNLKTFPYSQFHGKVHGIIGGYPCQPFSNAGQRKGEFDPRHLWPFIYEGIRAIRPVWCFFENVSGHLTLGFDQVYKDLSEMGYAVEAGIFSAAEVGAPHTRKRLFILAYDKRVYTGRKLANTDNRNGRHKQEQWKGQISATGICEEKLAYRNGERELQQKGVVGNKRGRAKHISSEVADTSRAGLQGGNKPRCNKIEWAKIRRSITRHAQQTDRDRWPATPGEPQYEWEEPRTTKSDVGFTANGYNFREDILRGAGNGVVWQTAAKAWSGLWEKMNK